MAPLSELGNALSRLFSPKPEAAKPALEQDKPEIKPAAKSTEVDNIFAINNLIAPEDPSKKISISELK
jgi:hypothetical protein